MGDRHLLRVLHALTQEVGADPTAGVAVLLLCAFLEPLQVLVLLFLVFILCARRRAAQRQRRDGAQSPNEPPSGENRA